MSQLNPTFLKEIVSALNSTRFSADDFDFNGDSYELINIKFKYDVRYNFTLAEEEITEEVTTGSTFLPTTSKSYSKSVTKLFSYESPGKYKSKDRIEISNFSNVSNRIISWCHNIHRELSHEGTYDLALEEAKESFKESLNIHVTNPTANFSKEQIENISEKLDDLFNKVNNISAQYEISESELNKLREDLNSLRENSKNYKQGVWAKMTENKLTQFVFDFLKSKEVRILIIDTIKKIGEKL